MVERKRFVNGTVAALPIIYVSEARKITIEHGLGVN